MDLATAFRWTAERYPHRRAVGGPAPMTYAEWDARTDRVAHALSSLGAGAGERAIFLLQGGEPLATLHLAAQKAGIASLPLSTRFGVDELAYCISDCSPVLIAVDETTHALVAQALETVERPPTLVWAGAAGNVPRGTASLAARDRPCPFWSGPVLADGG